MAIETDVKSGALRDYAVKLREERTEESTEETPVRGPEYDPAYDTSDSESDNEDEGEYLIATGKKGLRTIERALQLWLDRKKRLMASDDICVEVPLAKKEEYNVEGDSAFVNMVHMPR